MLEWYSGNQKDIGKPDGVVRAIPHVKYPVIVTEDLRAKAQLYYGQLDVSEKAIMVSIIHASSIEGWVSESIGCSLSYANANALRRTSAGSWTKAHAFPRLSSGRRYLIKQSET
jgi:hypothetical protein